jgi:choline kinase
MKAVILVAGFGSRLRPLTDNNHKALLPIGDHTTLELMITKLQRHGVSSFVLVTGHMEDKIRDYVSQTFPELDVTYVRNDNYQTTNTGYSLLMARPHVENDTFIKLDGDVNFDEEIIARLAATDDGASYVCVDKSDVDDEVIKVVLASNGKIRHIGNKLPVADAAGESIGIEKIAQRSATALFDALEKMVKDEANHQKYYEVAYETIVQQGEPFRVVDITGLKWVEMDNQADYDQALEYFGQKA